MNSMHWLSFELPWTLLYLAANVKQNGQQIESDGHYGEAGCSEQDFYFQLADAPQLSSYSVQSTYKGLDPMCKLCGEEVEDDRHIFWSCSCVTPVFAKPCFNFLRQQHYDSCKGII
ncbi:hypothetical protein EPI10_026770 [Gossypium australe]|uniref:Uncharacterized protein n=1 Tax=Gossypium australe TaxID=47621 RepID=A0A5B6USV2_9ROSI|nr:hypothetical protein EPI10_026770 [Gossypium australe]